MTKIFCVGILCICGILFWLTALYLIWSVMVGNSDKDNNIF